MWHSTSGMGWWMVFGSIWMVIIWGFLIWLFATVVSKATGRPPYGDKEDALEMARKRLAAGEITKEQFDEIKQRLN